MARILEVIEISESSCDGPGTTVGVHISLMPTKRARVRIEGIDAESQVVGCGSIDTVTGECLFGRTGFNCKNVYCTTPRNLRVGTEV